MPNSEHSKASAMPSLKKPASDEKNEQPLTPEEKQRVLEEAKQQIEASQQQDQRKFPQTEEERTLSTLD